MAKPDFNVFGTETYETEEGEKTRWTQVGVGFTNKESITIQLNAYPVNPKLVLLKPKEVERQKEKMEVGI